jgi:hypothetical protein
MMFSLSGLCFDYNGEKSALSNHETIVPVILSAAKNPRVADDSWADAGFFAALRMTGTMAALPGKAHQSFLVSFDPYIPRLLQIGPGIALKGHQGVGFRDAGEFYHVVRDDLGQVFVFVQAQQGHEVVFAGDGVDLGNPFDLQQALGGFVDLTALHIDKHNSGYHDDAPFR